MWVEGGLSDPKIKKGTFVMVEKLSFWESPVKIRDVSGTPNVYIALFSNKEKNERKEFLFIY